MSSKYAISKWLVLGPIFNPANQTERHYQGDDHPTASEIIKDIDTNELDLKTITKTLSNAPTDGQVVSYGNGRIFPTANYVWRTAEFRDVNWENISDIEDNIHKHLKVLTAPYPEHIDTFADKHHALVFFCILIDADKDLETELCVRSDDSIRVWLNGDETTELKHDKDRDIKEFSKEECTPISLKLGHNVLLIAVAETHLEWGMSVRLGSIDGLTLTTSKEEEKTVSDCNPYNAYDSIDGRLLITRTIDGPNLSFNEDLMLGEFQLKQAGLRPYVQLGFQQQWVVKEMFVGPVRNVLGLAPGERITTNVRTVDSYEFTSLVQNAMESSEVSTNTLSEGREFIDTNWDGNTVNLSKITVGEWGSFWENPIGWSKDKLEDGFNPINWIKDKLKDVVDWTKGAAKDVITWISGGSEGGGSPAPSSVTGKTVSVIEESLETIQKSQSSHLLTEHSSSVSRTRERSITRSFENPYFNRSLELRFSPIFRHFEVITTLVKFEWGLSLDVGKIQFPKNGIGKSYGDFLAARLTDQRLLSVANAELDIDSEFSSNASSDAIGLHLNANSEQYSKRLLRHMHANRNLNTLRAPVVQALRSMMFSDRQDPDEYVTDMQSGEQSDKQLDEQVKELSKAFQWSSVYTKGNSIFVPAADFALEKLEMEPEEKKAFAERLERVTTPKLKIVVSKKDIYLFAGTRVEAVPGDCVLPDVPITRPEPKCCCNTQTKSFSEDT